MPGQLAHLQPRGIPQPEALPLPRRQPPQDLVRRELLDERRLVPPLPCRLLRQVVDGCRQPLPPIAPTGVVHRPDEPPPLVVDGPLGPQVAHHDVMEERLRFLRRNAELSLRHAEQHRTERHVPIFDGHPPQESLQPAKTRPASSRSPRRNWDEELCDVQEPRQRHDVASP